MTQKTDNHLSANGEKKCTLKEGIGKVGGSFSHSWFKTWLEKQKRLKDIFRRLQITFKS